LDQGNQGVVRKEDFVNSLFQISASTLSPAQIMSLVQIYTNNFDNYVNYDDFIRAIDRSHQFGQDEAGPPNQGNFLRDQVQGKLQQLSQQDRETMDRIR